MAHCNAGGPLVVTRMPDARKKCLPNVREKSKTVPDVRALRSPWRNSVLLILAFILLSQAIVNGFKCEKFYKDTPDGAEIYGTLDNRVNENVTVTCVFNDSYHDANDIVFRTVENRKLVLMPSEIVNSTAVRLKPFSQSDFQQYRVFCSKRVKENPTDEEYTYQTLCFRVVNIGMPPLNITNLRCISEDWTGIHCTFDEPYNPIVTHYHMHYTVPGFIKQTEVNASGKDEITIQALPTTREYMSVRFTGVNALGNRTFIHTVNIYDSVIPGKPSCAVKRIEQTGVEMQYNITPRMEAFPHSLYSVLKFCQLPRALKGDLEDPRVKDYVENECFFKIANLTKIGLRENNHKPGTMYTLEHNMDTYPAMRYILKLFLHTGAKNLQQDLYSEPCVLNVTLLGSKPTHPVNIDDSAYEVVNYQQSRNVYIYCNATEEINMNGDNYRYVVTALNQNNRELKKIVTANTTVLFEKLSLLHNYTFLITSKNEYGESKERVHLPLPASNFLPTTLKKFSVVKFPPNEDYYEGYYHVYLRDTSDEYDYILYSCVKPTYSNRCMGKHLTQTLDTTDTTLNSDGRSISFIIDGSSKHGQYHQVSDNKFIIKHDNQSVQVFVVPNVNGLSDTLFGVARRAKDSGMSSGIKWATCTVPYSEQNPAPHPPQLTVLNSTSVQVSWRLECIDHVTIPLGVQITYCEVYDNNTCMHDLLTRNETLQSPAVISGLRPFSRVAVYIAIISYKGISKVTEPVVAKLPQCSPWGSVTDVKLLSTGTSFVKLFWSPPDPRDMNGDLTMYRITTIPITRIYEFAPFQLEHDEVELKNLDPYTTYKVSIVACTEVGCAQQQYAANLTFSTLPDVPSPVSWSTYNPYSGVLSWQYDYAQDCHGKSCDFVIRTVQNDSVTAEYQTDGTSVTLDQLGVECKGAPVNVSIKVLGQDEKGKELHSPWWQSDPICSPAGISPTNWYIIVGVASVSIVIVLVTVVLMKCGANICSEIKEPIKVPPLVINDMMDGDTLKPSKDRLSAKVYGVSREPNRILPSFDDSSKKTPLLSQTSHSSDIEEEALRHGRNPSGSSGSSEADSAVASADGTDEHDTSSDTVPIQDGGPFVLLGDTVPYVQHGVVGHNASEGYVTVRSNPSLHNLQQYSTSTAALQHRGSTPNLPAVNTTNPSFLFRSPATSAGYFSTTESEPPDVELIPRRKNIVSPLPAYSRHSFTPPNKMRPDSRGGEVKYVMVACGEESRLSTPPSSSGDKRQSMPSLLTTIPDDNNGSYCVVGQQQVPGTGYVTAGSPPPSAPSVAASTGYVAHSEAPSTAGSYRGERQGSIRVDSGVSNDSLGSSGYVDPHRWARSRFNKPPMECLDMAEEVRDIASAPSDLLRNGMGPVRPSDAVPQQERPRTSDCVTQFRPKKLSESPSGWQLGRPCLSKQSSGYVSQEALFGEQIITPSTLTAPGPRNTAPRGTAV